MIYTVSAIHGRYDEYMALLDTIHFRDSDEMFVLGESVDRAHPA